jgi:hypothetical protein
MESVIAYTDRLWRSLVRPPRERRRTSKPSAGRLAPWFATSTKDQDPDHVIAIAAHSGLTLVFEAAAVEEFKPAMVGALRRVFEDLGIDHEALGVETSDIEAASFLRLRDATIRSDLDFVEFIAGTEFLYHDDVRRVQLNLNELPRGHRCRASRARLYAFCSRRHSATRVLCTSERAVPEIARFFGVVIGMYYNEHGAPHFHAVFGEFKISVEIERPGARRLPCPRAPACA